MDYKIKRKLVMTIVSFALIFGLSIGGTLVYAAVPDDLSIDTNTPATYITIDGKNYAPPGEYEMPTGTSITLEEFSAVVEYPVSTPSGFITIIMYKSYDGNTWDQIGSWLQGDLATYNWYTDGKPGMVWWQPSALIGENIDIANKDDVYFKLEIYGQTAPAAVWHFSKPQDDPIDDGPSNDNTKPSGNDDTKNKEGNSPQTNDSTHVATMIGAMAIILLMLLGIYIKRGKLFVSNH